MGPNQTYKLLHGKGSHKQNEKTTNGIGENINFWKLCDQQGLNFQNIQQLIQLNNKKTNNPIEKWAEGRLSPKKAFSSVQLLSHVQLFATPWIAACQASLSITNSRSSLRLTSIKSVILSSHLILCRPLLLLPPIPPSISLFQWVNSSHEVAKVLEFQL